MTIQSLIDRLSSPDVYPEGVEFVEICQTHISVVFLTERWAYKIKKPVALDFLDYSTLEKRRRYCRREVKLNRRLAPEVYRGVVPIIETSGDSGLRVDPPEDGDIDSDQIVEWAVKMVRLSDDATLQSKLRAGKVGREVFEDLATKLADFYADAERGTEISEAARFEPVSRNVRDNIRAAEQQVGELLHPTLFERLEDTTERALADLRDVIEARAERDVARDTHGDLRLEHVYLQPDREGLPFIVVDCIEFNDAFRYADPMSDVAFMAMDLQHEGRWDLADAFAEAYLSECRRVGGEAAEIADVPDRSRVRQLLRLYVSYRAAIRGKVKGMKAMEEEVEPEEREAAGREAISYWLHALGALQPAAQRPALVVVAGLPGTGKSTIAEALASEAGFCHLDSDVIRKEAAGLAPDEPAPTEPNGGLYADCWSDETYQRLRDRARSELVQGSRVVIEATMRSRDRRRPFWELAEELSVPIVMMVCEAPDDEVEGRLRRRDSGPSDADVQVFRRLREEWEAFDDGRERSVVRIDTSADPETSRGVALDALRDRRLV